MNKRYATILVNVNNVIDGHQITIINTIAIICTIDIDKLKKKP